MSGSSTAITSLARSRTKMHCQPPLTRMIQYSSNEGDLVCDLFLGGFSRVKAAIGLNWKVIGFEVSIEIFGVKTEEIASLQPVLCFPRSGPL